MLQLRETIKGYYSLVLDGVSIGTCLGDHDHARKYAAAMNAELILGSKSDMPVFVATLKVIRETEIAVRFSMPNEDLAKEFLDEIAFDSDLDLGECLERQQGEVVDSDVRIEVGCHPEISTDQSQNLTREIEEFVGEYLAEKEEATENTDD